MEDNGKERRAGKSGRGKSPSAGDKAKVFQTRAAERAGVLTRATRQANRSRPRIGVVPEGLRGSVSVYLHLPDNLSG